MEKCYRFKTLRDSISILHANPNIWMHGSHAHAHGITQINTMVGVTWYDHPKTWNKCVKTIMCNWHLEKCIRPSPVQADFVVLKVWWIFYLKIKISWIYTNFFSIILGHQVAKNNPEIPWSCNWVNLEILYVDIRVFFPFKF
jgi:hypothetical protein